MSVTEISHVRLVDEYIASYVKMMKSSATYQCAATVHAQTTPLALPTSRNMSPNTVVILVVSDGEDPYIITQHIAAN